MMDFETSRLLKRGLPLYTVLSATLLLLALATILRLGRDVFVPIALAILLSFVLAPAVRLMQRLGIKQRVSVILVVTFAFCAIGGIALIAGNQLATLASEIPRYQSTIRSKITSLSDRLTPGGGFARAIDAFEGIGRELDDLRGGPNAGDAAGEQKPVTVVVRESAGFFGTLSTVISPLLHPLATAALVLLLVIFVLSAREDLRNRVVRIVGTEDIQHTTEVIDDAARRLSRLFLAQLTLNSIFGAVVALGLWAIGIPSPLLWGILAGVFRFLPYIGGVVGVLPPIILSFAIDPGWSMFLMTVAFFAVIEPIAGQVVEPMVLGRRTGLAPIAVVVSVSVWTFLWGPIGLVLSTPLTVCLVVLGRHVDQLEFLDIMLGDRPALSPPQLFYQRMLAGDPTEAAYKAKEFLRERALATYYDEVALEGLRLAHQDYARGRLSRERLSVVLRSTSVLIERLDSSIRDPRPVGGQVGAEAAAAVVAAGPDQREAIEVLSPDQLAEGWRGTRAVLCFAASGTLDEVIARMLAQVLRKHGIGADVISTPQIPDATADVASKANVRLVCLSYIDPLSTLHLRHAVRVTRRASRGVQVLLGIWRERDATMGRALSKSARADAMVPTIGLALSVISKAAKSPQLGAVARSA